MSIDTETMIDEVYSACGIDEDDKPRSFILLQLNKSFWELMNKLNFRENELSGSFSLTINQPRYTLPVLFEAIRSIATINPDDSQSTSLNQQSSQWYNDKLITSTILQYGQPTDYWRENNEIILWPTPNKAYVTNLQYIVTLDDIADSPTNFLPIPQVWHEIIELGGTWRTFYLLGDKTQSDNIHNTQIGMINSTVPVEAVEQADTQMARAIPVRPTYNLISSSGSSRRLG